MDAVRVHHCKPGVLPVEDSLGLHYFLHLKMTKPDPRQSSQAFKTCHEQKYLKSDIYFLTHSLWVQNQVTISCIFISLDSHGGRFRILIEFLIWPEKDTSVFNDMNEISSEPSGN